MRPFAVLLFASASLGLTGVASAQSADATAAAPQAAEAAAATASAAPVLEADGKIKLMAGTKVVDVSEATVGVLKEVELDAAGKPVNVVLKTDKHEVKFPASSLARTEKHAVFGMTQAELNAAAEAAQASAQTAGANAEAKAETTASN